ncbi:EF-hand domain-containing family member C2 [Chelonus insularis]|uniref:EF-hand domain-containing family member C2 n=1 Tax=Chelonus insularis TaxID=460826 RepID=UPI0015884770|nr:EF-hand domain-containing family member C2 [Chelonus insularis]
MEINKKTQKIIFPSLPGYNPPAAKNFHISQQFEKIHDGVYYLVDRLSVEDRKRYSPLYPFHDEKNMPPWLAYDSQRLMFTAYFKDDNPNRRAPTYQIHVVKISFFLEDGTIKIVEPNMRNSGLQQGVLVRRQRIPLPGSSKYRFFDIIDLNIGKQVEIYGRIYNIVDCDQFTRQFLNRMGIAVSDPLEIPLNPFVNTRIIPMSSKKLQQKPDTLGKFLKYDRKVLKFIGYWDDTANEYGVIHSLELYYYLADDTIEIKEILPPNSSRDLNATFLKRMKIPKFYTGIDPIGVHDPFTVLNVLGDSTGQSYYIADPLNTGKPSCEYYKDSDLVIGVRMNVFGREVVITDLDSATKEYYRTKYGIEEFTPLERPDIKPDYYHPNADKHKPPPYNGFGSYDDSFGNCFRIVPKPPKIDYVRSFQYDKKPENNNILRFTAKMISDVSSNADRQFIINIHLMDNTISIFELAMKNTGFQSCRFQKRMPIMLPDQEIYSSDKPRFYDPCFFYIGAVVNIGKFQFLITSADDYTIRYMEENCDKFCIANPLLIIDKIREAIKPSYKEFIQNYEPVIESGEIPVLSCDKLREALYKYLEKNICEHEIITIARHYKIRQKPERNLREDIRRLIHNEIKRFLWNDLDRLEEDINHWDPSGSGLLPRNQVYTILRGCRLPVDPKVINAMLNCITKNEEGKIDCKDLLEYLNVKVNPVTPIHPMSLKETLWWTSEEKDYCPGLNWSKFLNDLNISEDNPISAMTGSQ